MRQLYEKSGSSARLSDFAIDIRRVVQANGLPEYLLSIRRNGEGAEIIHFVHRSHLAIDDPQRRGTRFPGRRHTFGIFSKI